MNGGPPELDHRLVNGGQTWSRVPAGRNPIKTRDNNVFRYANPTFVQMASMAKPSKKRFIG